MCATNKEQQGAIEPHRRSHDNITSSICNYEVLDLTIDNIFEIL